MFEQQQHEVINLKPYQPFGIPILKLMGGIALLSFLATGLYEYFVL